MFRKVLYPTDFSDVAGKAMGYLKQLKDAGTEEVVILHVVDARYIHRNLHIPMHYALKDFEELEEKYAIQAQDAVDSLAETLTDMGLKVIVRIERGIPFKEILRVESEENVSLIVIGSHGRSNVEEMLMGSVSEKVIRKAKKPVLVVKR